jgi:hypothetical protein
MTSKMRVSACVRTLSVCQRVSVRISCARAHVRALDRAVTQPHTVARTTDDRL